MKPTLKKRYSCQNDERSQQVKTLNPQKTEPRKETADNLLCHGGGPRT